MTEHLTLQQQHQRLARASHHRVTDRRRHGVAAHGVHRSGPLSAKPLFAMKR